MAYEKYADIKVLLIDDFKKFLTTVKGMLESFGVTKIDSVVNASQAISLCKFKQYDLILCDYNLGQNKKNGRQLLEELRYYRLLKKTTIFVMVTAEASRSMVMATYDYEPDGYIVKPFNAHLLKHRLDRLFLRREALSDVHLAISDGDEATAIAVCEAKIEEGNRYCTDYQKILGKLYLEQKMLMKSQWFYEEILQRRSIEWANVGLARAKLARGDKRSAVELSEDIIKANPHCMPAYDILSEIYSSEGKLEELQLIQQKAVEVCPLAIRRQQRLACIAEHNNDLNIAAKAFLKSAELGECSLYDNLDVYLGLGRSAAGLMTINDPAAGAYLKKAKVVLEDAEKRFECNALSFAHLNLVRAQLEASNNNLVQAESLLDLAEKTTEDEKNNLGIDLAVDWVKTHIVCGHEKRSKEILDDLVEEHCENDKALEKLDKMLDKPVSPSSRKCLATINREGIGLYEKKRFKEAIDIFRKAQLAYPRYITVHLNLAQAVNGLIRENGYEAEAMALCLNSLSRVESQISEKHEQYDRYCQLNSVARELCAQK